MKFECENCDLSREVDEQVSIANKVCAGCGTFGSLNYTEK